MAAAGHPGEDARLFDAVHAVGMELCPEIDLSIPVGKDSLSMQAQWVGAGIGESGFGIREGDDQGSAVPNAQSPIPNPGLTNKSVSPVSLVVTAFAARSEERRVGKEWGSTSRSRWMPFHLN